MNQWMITINIFFALSVAGCSGDNGGSTDDEPGTSSPTDTGSPSSDSEATNSILQDTGRSGRDTTSNQTSEDANTASNDGSAESKSCDKWQNKVREGEEYLCMTKHGEDECTAEIYLHQESGKCALKCDPSVRDFLRSAQLDFKSDGKFIWTSDTGLKKNCQPVDQ